MYLDLLRLFPPNKKKGSISATPNKGPSGWHPLENFTLPKVPPYDAAYHLSFTPFPDEWIGLYGFTLGHALAIALDFLFVFVADNFVLVVEIIRSINTFISSLLLSSNRNLF